MWGLLNTSVAGGGVRSLALVQVCRAGGGGVNKARAGGAKEAKKDNERLK